MLAEYFFFGIFFDSEANFKKKKANFFCWLAKLFFFSKNFFFGFFVFKKKRGQQEPKWPTFGNDYPSPLVILPVMFLYVIGANIIVGYQPSVTSRVFGHMVKKLY